MYKSATKCNETVGKWCKNKHGASKIIDTLETYQTPSRNRRGVATVTKGRGRQAGQSPGGASTMEAEPSNKGIDEDLRCGAHPGAAGRSGTTALEASHRTADENGEKGRGGKNLGEREGFGGGDLD
jgi:hypothetical protein